MKINKEWFVVFVLIICVFILKINYNFVHTNRDNIIIKKDTILTDSVIVVNKIINI